MYVSPTAESKHKGDEGIYAAIDAARLAQALRGATLSRLTARDRMLVIAARSGGGAGVPNPTSSTSASVPQPPPPSVDATGTNGPVLGAPPKAFQPTNASESVRCRVRQEALADPALNHETQVAVGIPDSIGAPAFRALAPHIQKLRPGKPLTFDELQRLLQMVRLCADGRQGHGVCTLDLTGCVVPSSVATPGANESTADVAESESDSQGGRGDGHAAAAVHSLQLSAEAVTQLMAQLRERYPLPTPEGKKRRGEGSSAGAADEDAGEDEEEEIGSDGEGEDQEALQHNAALRARCELLQMPYTTYEAALLDMAVYEAEVFPLVCQFLSRDDRLQVVLLGYNRLGAESRKTPGTVDLRALRALASMIDANESIKVLDLSHNELGPNGVGVVAKALTKNIGLQEIDLSDNGLSAEAREEAEDPEFAEEDPVFGERYAGLEAISEVIKKNKFLRVLRLGNNGIHAGDDLTAPAEEDKGGVEEDEGGAAVVPVPTPEDVVAQWEEEPLWRLVQPLQKFHRLTVLDLRGNHLGVRGARMLATALSTNRSVRAVDLTDNGIGYGGLHYLASLVLASPTSVLETLILQRNDLAGKSRNPSTLKKLRLRPKKAALAAMMAFADAMRNNRTVRRLVLAENHLGPLLSAALLATISRAEVLEELDFSWNEACGDHESLLDLTAIRSLAAALYPSTASTGPSGSPGAQAQESRFPHQPTLARLYLSGNNLCAAGLAALFPGGGLAPQYALQELDLSRNYIGDALAPLSHLLQVSPTVLRLNLSYNNVSSLAGMLPGLRANTSLECLDLSHNKLGSLEELHHLPSDFGGTAVSMVGSLKDPQALLSAAAQTIEHNDPDACAAQRADVASLWRCLANHTSLAEVNVSWNDLREEHAHDFLEAFSCADGEGAMLPRSSALAKVDIGGNPKIPSPLVAALLAALAPRPGMKVVYTSLPRRAAAQLSSKGGHNVDVEEEKGQQQTMSDILHIMTRAVTASDTLLDVGCGGLTLGDGSEEAVEAMRRKLLLNAMLAGRA